MIPNLTIRRMTPADLEAVVALDRLSFSQPWPKSAFVNELNAPYSRSWVAEHEGNIIGMIVIWLTLDEAHIATLAIHPDFRRQGIARQLIIHTLRAAWKEGARYAFLEVRRSNHAAQALYQSLGFVQSGERPHYYQDNGEDALLMTLKPDTMQALLHAEAIQPESPITE